MKGFWICLCFISITVPLYSANVELTIANPIDIVRSDEPVILKRNELVKHFGELKNHEIIVPYHDGTMLPCQHDDLDNDGNWDELFFLVDLKERETIKIVLKQVAKSELPIFKSRTNIHFAKKIKDGDSVKYKEMPTSQRIAGTNTKVTVQNFQFEGPGWENDKVAFRNYFDQRNGIDIFGKTTPEMVLEEVGAGQDYHILQDWGMDILKVGNSLGAGALALSFKNSLFRLTSTNSDFEIVTEGPLRSIIQFNFQNVVLDDKEVIANHRVSIVAGKYYYTSEVTLNSQNDIALVSGIVNMHSDTLYSDVSDQSSVFCTYDKQSVENENLGMAIMLQDKYYIDTIVAPESGDGIIQSYCISMATGYATWRFYACWEKSDDHFNTYIGYKEFLSNEKIKFDNPLKIKI